MIRTRKTIITDVENMAKMDVIRKIVGHIWSALIAGRKATSLSSVRKLKKAEPDQSFWTSTTNWGNSFAALQQADKNDMSNSFPFTQKQCQQILHMLSNKKSPMENYVDNSSTHDELSGKVLCFSSQGKKVLWILDSGATDYIICGPELLTISKVFFITK